MFKLIKPVTAEGLADMLQLSYNGKKDIEVKGIKTLTDNQDHCLVFSKGHVDNSVKGIVITPSADENVNAIFSANPRLDFIRALELLNKEVGFKSAQSKPDIHSSVSLGQNVVIENGVSIGANTIIEHNAVIFSGTNIGKNCLIRANSTIGSDGYGFERAADGSPIKFIHLGGVQLGNNVEVGANTCIAKGTLSDTIIKDDVKIDNLVHIAHNCIINKGAFIIACSELSGGVEIGENCWVAPNASITQKVKVGDNALVGLGAVVTKNVESETIVAGNPAKFIRKNK